MLRFEVDLAAIGGELTNFDEKSGVYIDMLGNQLAREEIQTACSRLFLE